MATNLNPSNHGARWTPEQDAWLLQAVRTKKVSDISAKMSRTEGSIMSRLKLIAYNNIAKGATLEEAATLTGLSISVIQQDIAKRESQPPPRAMSTSSTSSNKPKKLSLSPFPLSSPLSHDMLNDEQRNVLTKIAEGKNVLITGGAGVGKSFTLKYILQWALHGNKNIGVTAMTGSAAVLIDGTTLHSFLGIRLGRDPAEALVRKIRKHANGSTFAKLATLDVLIIDEVSMLNDELFEKVSDVLSIIRKNKTTTTATTTATTATTANANAFGGVQIIMVGDPYQLSPIEGSYFFTSKKWSSSGFEICVLKANMRQKGDIEFKQLLDRVRQGECNEQDISTLEALKDTAFPQDIIPTRLYSVNRDVDRINDDALQELIDSGAKGVITYGIKFGGNAEVKKSSRKWAETLKLRQELRLCIGAQVMLTRNVDINEGLVNGARGVVTLTTPSAVWVRLTNGITHKIEYYKVNPYGDIYDEDDIQDHKNEENTNIINASYIPLQLAWAISIHKSQGTTLDAVEIDLGDSIFACGQAYTALSRAKNMRSVRITSVKASSFRTHPAVLKFMLSSYTE